VLSTLRSGSATEDGSQDLDDPVYSNVRLTLGPLGSGAVLPDLSELNRSRLCEQAPAADPNPPHTRGTRAVLWPTVLPLNLSRGEI
jgi:hypothetical protein